MQFNEVPVSRRCAQNRQGYSLNINLNWWRKDLDESAFRRRAV